MIVIIQTDDAYEIEGLTHAENFRSALCDIGNYLRTASDKGDSEEMVKISDVYDALFKLMKHNLLDRDMIGF